MRISIASLLLSIVIVTLVVPSHPNADEHAWTRFGSTEKDVLYYDPKTMKKDGLVFFVWLLEDLKHPAQNEKHKIFRSKLIFESINCKTFSNRNYSFSAHSEHMGAGDTIFYNGTPDNFDTKIVPGSDDDQLLNVLCRGVY